MKLLTPLLIYLIFSFSVLGKSMVQPGAKVEKLAEGNEIYRRPRLVTQRAKADFFGYPQQCTYAMEPKGWLVRVSEE
jgi:hypothetical protein